MVLTGAAQKMRSFNKHTARPNCRKKAGWLVLAKGVTNAVGRARGSGAMSAVALASQSPYWMRRLATTRPY